MKKRLASITFTILLFNLLFSNCTWQAFQERGDEKTISEKENAQIAPSPDVAEGIHNGDIGMKVWGPNNRITLSIGKSDVWDRRWLENMPAAKLSDIKEWAKMENCSEIFEDGNYYQAYAAYDFPCPKPVGQLILGLPGDPDNWKVNAQKDTIPGSIKIEAKRGEQSVTMRIYVHAKRNLIVLEGNASKPLDDFWLRLYRHRDTNEQGKAHLGGLSKSICEKYDYSKDKNNGPIEPPKVSNNNAMGWITQVFPREPTFPEGFRYIFAAVTSLNDVKISNAEGKHELGTPAFSPNGPWSYENYIVPDYQPINKAKGAAVTFNFPRIKESFQILATVVTSTDSSGASTSDLIHIAQSRLNKALEEFPSEALEESPSKRFNEHIEGTKMTYYPFLTRRPGGYYGAVPQATWPWSSISFTPSFWTDFYCAQDATPWHGDFHFNEQQYSTHHFILNNEEILEPYFQLVEGMLPLAQRNAREVYDCPGAMYPLTHFPIRTDKVINSTLPWEQSMEITALTIKPFWEHYLYTGDKEFLRNRSYKLLREGARFYAAYLTFENDGYYHVFPTVSPEHWGLTKNLERNKDSQSSLTLIKYHLKAAVQAAEMLGLDKKEREKWKHIAENMAPYPIYNTPEGPIFVDVRGAPPITYYNSVPLTAIFWGDDITLESSTEVLDIARRTIKNIQARNFVDLARCLLGEYVEDSEGGYLEERRDIRPENLLQSRGGWDMVAKRGGWIRVFPAVPENYTGSFRNYLAIGGFEVSAISEYGVVTELTIYSKVGNLCRLINPWPDNQILIKEAGVNKKALNRKGDHVEFSTMANTVYKIEPLY